MIAAGLEIRVGNEIEIEIEFEFEFEFEIEIEIEIEIGIEIAMEAGTGIGTRIETVAGVVNEWCSCALSSYLGEGTF